MMNMTFSQLQEITERREQVSIGKSFFSKSALLPDEVVVRYASTFPYIFGDSPQLIRRNSLELMGILEQYIQRILVATLLLEQSGKMKQ
ncbi:archaeal ATPase [Galdieria sulphuraria]|uniref:Archaeal ATPase n=1 Tax=Galdieria sulphuraria TaxID=130081 RepID=M2Y5D1_GALSU|nr:archaeal ATPase [Galdieria sulphuraria]EME31064.1 archaeal ATPase [Galdieria sulphuraria]|eukprot:XP_005707584.1 archaeal ATPase [Galdieria sulphuraria]